MHTKETITQRFRSFLVSLLQLLLYSFIAIDLCDRNDENTFHLVEVHLFMLNVPIERAHDYP